MKYLTQRYESGVSLVRHCRRLIKKISSYKGHRLFWESFCFFPFSFNAHMELLTHEISEVDSFVLCCPLVGLSGIN